MAKVIAEGLQGELNAVLVHKIPAPGQEEFAIGSVGLSGEVFRLPYIQAYSISESYVQAEARVQLEKLKKRKEQFHLPLLNCQGRITILVDDGIATGATAIGAIKELRAQKPKKLILAAGVIPAANVGDIKPLVDEFVVLEQPEDFYAVSQFFADFTQVSDEEVCQLFLKPNSEPHTSDLTG